jgi:hypothetical protein
MPIPPGLNSSDGDEWFHFQGNSVPSLEVVVLAHKERVELFLHLQYTAPVDVKSCLKPSLPDEHYCN